MEDAQKTFREGNNGHICEERLRLQECNLANRKDHADDRIARWGRSQHEGYRKFKHSFLQPPPLFFTQDHHPLWLGDMYRGSTAFLIAGGGRSANSLSCGGPLFGGRMGSCAGAGCPGNVFSGGGLAITVDLAIFHGSALTEGRTRNN